MKARILQPAESPDLRATWRSRLVYRFMRGLRARANYHHAVYLGAGPGGEVAIVITTPDGEIIAQTTMGIHMARNLYQQFGEILPHAELTQ